MNFLQYVAIFTLLSVTSTAQYLEFRPVNFQTQPSASEAQQIPEYLQRNQKPTLAYTLQLPTANTPSVPFYNSEAIVDLQPPSGDNQKIPFYYEYPEPSTDLQAPAEGNWNPNNDPKFYYDNVPILIDLETPTNLHPKKYVKDTHEKKYSAEPKKEVILKPITQDELVQIQKTVNRLAKLENQKQIRTEKTEQTVQI